MVTKRKGISALLAMALTAVMVAGCGGNAGGNSSAGTGTGSATDSGAAKNEKDVITVGFAQVGAESDWRTANSESMKETFSEANGYELIFDDAQQKQENQITAIRNFIQQEVDYIILAPVTETGWDTVLQEAKDADIPVITVDRMVDVSDDDLFACYIGGNFKLEGAKAAAWLKAYADAKGLTELNIAHIQGTIGASAQIGRTEGLEKAAKEYGWNIVAQQTGEFTQAKGQEVMESMLKQHDNINVVYCENDNEAFGAIDAIKAAGKTVGPDGDILVISFDTVKAGIEATLTGDIICNVECNPLHGPRVAEIIQKLEAGESVDKIAYVDEGIYAYGKDVASVTVDGTEYAVTEVTRQVIDGRKY